MLSEALSRPKAGNVMSLRKDSNLDVNLKLDLLEISMDTLIVLLMIAQLGVAIYAIYKSSSES
ncbi:MAG: hypothetical protein ACJA1E_000025 [Paracoccaceae bacterium]|jgi:hypothetical protein